MTRDEILNMPAGIEMDALVAEKVMRWKRLKYFGGGPIADGWLGFWDGEWFKWIERPESDDEEASKPWSPSTNIAEAWAVEEKIKVLHLEDKYVDFLYSLIEVNEFIYNKNFYVIHAPPI